MRALRIGIAGLVASIVAACDPGDRILAPSEWHVVWHVEHDDVFSMTSSADGALFVATFDGLVYRSTPDDSGDWQRIALAVDTTEFAFPYLLRLYAPSASTLFGVSGPHVLRWDEGVGLQVVQTPLSTEWVWCDHHSTSEHLNDVWGRGANDVYAVGDHGVILHFDGTDWTLEPNVLREQAPSVCYEAFATDLSAVGGDEQGVYAAGMQSVIGRTTGGWQLIERPQGVQGEGLLTGVSGHDGDILFAGGDFQRIGDAPPYEFRHPGRLFRLRNGAWVLENDEVERATMLNGGSAHPGERALFWNTRGWIVVVDGGDVTSYRVDGFDQLRGAEIVAGRIHVAGNRGDQAIVARLPF